MANILDVFEKHGFLFVLLSCFALLPPNLQAKVSLMNLDLNEFNSSLSGSSLKKQVLWLLPLSLYVLSFIRMRGGLQVNEIQRKIFVLFVPIVSVFVISYVLNGNALMLKRMFFQLVMIFVISSAIYFSLKKKSISGSINILVIIIIGTCVASLLLNAGLDNNGSFTAWAKSKNNLGSYLLAAVLLLWYAKNYLPGRIYRYRYKLICLLILLLLSYSKTTIALAALFIVYDVFRLSLNPRILMFLVFLATSIFIILPGVSSLFGGEWYIALNMNPDTLTGRGHIWEVLYYDLFSYDKLWFGYGYSSYFNTGLIPFSLDDSSSFLRFLNSAHNGYLELLLQFGVLFSGILAFLIYKIVMLTKDSGVYLVALIVFLHNITESSFFREAHIMWVLLIIIICFSLINTNIKKVE